MVIAMSSQDPTVIEMTPAMEEELTFGRDPKGEVVGDGEVEPD